MPPLGLRSCSGNRSGFYRQERIVSLAVKVNARVSLIELGRRPMTRFGKLSTLTAYLSLAFVGAIVLGLL